MRPRPHWVAGPYTSKRLANAMAGFFVTEGAMAAVIYGDGDRWYVDYYRRMQVDLGTISAPIPGSYPVILA